MTRFKRPASVFLNGAGAGEVFLTPTGGDWVIVHQAVKVSTNAAEPTANVFISGVFLEGSYTGSNDASDTRVVLQQGGDEARCVWAGGDPGALATYTVTVVQYPAGTAPME